MDKPNSLSRLMDWMLCNKGAEFNCVRATITQVDGQHNFLIDKSVKVQVSRPQTNGVYLINEGQEKETWLGLSDTPDHQYVFTDDYFGIISVNQIEGNKQIMSRRFDYVYSLATNKNVRGVLNCSVGDLNAINAMKRLTNEELEYCIEKETRKSGIQKLKVEARKRGLTSGFKN